uniref:EGF-like domain-containing protein n=1 Tax=Macrostomum lignano TaxID=282301 RepID=A0A1I8J319_9PLAT
MHFSAQMLLSTVNATRIRYYRISWYTRIRLNHTVNATQSIPFLIGSQESLSCREPQDVSKCDSKPCGLYATCTDTPGSYNCTCFDGFQGNGTDNCTAQMLLSTVNATRIRYTRMSSYTRIWYRRTVDAPHGIPFLIGSQESLSCRVSQYGAISFSGYRLRHLPYNSTSAKINFTGAVVAPYWFVKPATNYYRRYWTPKVSFELLNSRNHSSSSNWRAVKQIIEQEIRS